MIPLYGTSYTTCISCDTTFNETLNIKQDCIRQTERANTVHNNTRNASSFTSTSSTSQSHISQRQQFVSNDTRSVQSNNIDSIGTFGISERRAQNHSFNVSRPNRPNIVRESATVSNNRENSTSWINTHNLNNSSDQPAARNSRNMDNKTSAWGNIDNNAEIMCKCHETAIQLTVRKEGPNKGK